MPYRRCLGLRREMAHDIRAPMGLGRRAPHAMSASAAGALCATSVPAHASLSRARVSAHLGCLVGCGLLEVRRAGRFAPCPVTDPRVTEVVELGASMVADHAQGVATCTSVASVP